MFTSLLLAALVTPALAAETPDYRPSERSYTLVYAPNNELHMISVAGPTLQRMSIDAWLYGASPHLSPGVDAVFGTAWSMFFTYTTMLWPHEFGHWSRAHQVDSTFTFHNANPFLPRTTVEMPEDASNADRALLSVGGFEINGLVARQAQLDFYKNGGAWSDELAHALLNEAFFPMYAGIFRAKAKEPETWIETRGDPVHFVLPVYQRATGREPITATGEVDPELVGLYRESVALSVAWTVLDPGLIQQAMAFGDRGFHARQAWMPIRTEHFGWTWGTQFNPSPLGYELYLNQYLVVDDRTFELSVKMGRPMKNRGLRLHAPNLFENDRLRIGAEAEVWDQDEYGVGALGGVEVNVELTHGIGLVGWGGYKSEGYAMGRAIDEGAFGAVGLSYSFRHLEPGAKE